MSAMSLRVRATSLLAVASLTSTLVAGSARAQGTGSGDAALAHAVEAARVSLIVVHDAARQQRVAQRLVESQAVHDAQRKFVCFTHRRALR